MKILQLSLVSMMLLTGCASYATPGGKADLAGITQHSIREGFAAKPAATFPASIAAVHVQAPQYYNYHTRRYGGVKGTGRYSVVTIREVEQDADYNRIIALPGVGGLVSISPLLIPNQLNSDLELREAAARLKADLLLLYTFDTNFYKDEKSRTLSTVTLGLSPTKNVHVNVTASALILDTRTGYIHGALEASEHRESLTNAWESKDTADRERRDAEAAAFKALVSEFETLWPKIVANAQPPAEARAE